MNIKEYSTSDIDKILVELKSKQFTILSCINHFYEIFNLSLRDAQEIVLNSKVWEIEKEQWIKNNDESEMEFYKAMRDDE